MDNFFEQTRDREPCPNCGANPYSWEPKRGYVAVRCTNCNFNGPLKPMSPKGRPGEGEDAAVRDWNRISLEDSS